MSYVLGAWLRDRLEGEFCYYVTSREKFKQIQLFEFKMNIPIVEIWIFSRIKPKLHAIHHTLFVILTEFLFMYSRFSTIYR